jgi:hypothetical protein
VLPSLAEDGNRSSDQAGLEVAPLVSVACSTAGSVDAAASTRPGGTAGAAAQNIKSASCGTREAGTISKSRRSSAWGSAGLEVDLS